MHGLPRDAIDLATKLLAFEPEHRINAKTALTHDFLKELSDPNDEPVCVQFSFPELETMSLQDLRKSLWEASHENVPKTKEKRRNIIDIDHTPSVLTF